METHMWSKARMLLPNPMIEVDWQKELIDNIPSEEFDIYVLGEKDNRIYAIVDCKNDEKAFNELSTLTPTVIFEDGYEGDYDEHLVCYRKCEDKIFTCMDYELIIDEPIVHKSVITAFADLLEINQYEFRVEVNSNISKKEQKLQAEYKLREFLQRNTPYCGQKEYQNGVLCVDRISASNTIKLDSILI